MERLSPYLTKKILDKIELKDHINICLVSPDLNKKICQNYAKYMLKEYYRFDIPVNWPPVNFYLLVKQLELNKAPIFDKPENMKYSDFILNLWTSGKLVHDHYWRTEYGDDADDDDYQYKIAQNVCRYWVISGVSPIYLDVYGNLYAPNKRFDHVIDKLINTYNGGINEDSIILKDVLDVALSNKKSILILKTNHILYGFGPHFNPDSDSFIPLQTNVIDLWDDEEGKYYFYRTENNDTYKYDMKNKFPSPLYDAFVVRPPLTSSIEVLYEEDERHLSIESITLELDYQYPKHY